MSSGGRRRMGERTSEERWGEREGERAAGIFSWARKRNEN